MGGGGSIQNMQTMLNNNRKLLKSRIPIFKRQDQFANLKDSYRRAHKALKPGPELSEEVRQEIRKRVRKEQSRMLQLKIGLSLVLFIALFAISYMVSSGFSINNEAASLKKRAAAEAAYRSALLSGDDMFQQEKWFFAAANFETALEYRPNDVHLNYKWALCFCKMCHDQQRGCERAKQNMNMLLAKFPEEKIFNRLQRDYLSGV